jgi:uncharacterized membrane protein YkvA (DUF1232 family)
MEPSENHEPGTETEKSDVHIEDLFNHKEWKDKAEDPGVLESIGRKLDESLETNTMGLQAYLDDLKLAYEMLRAPDFTIEKSTKIVLIIALLYVVSPIDLIPDGIPFIGLLDDLLVAGYAIKQAASELERYRKFKQRLQ